MSEVNVTARDVSILVAMQQALQFAIKDNALRLESIHLPPSTRQICRAKDKLMREQYTAMDKAIALMTPLAPTPEASPDEQVH